ncbi:MAG: TIGR00269 family protein [Methanobacterium sp. ERen5]|nr:MAG: TIGR00269 family protein [Methanobacterium sp. ERen5]
MNECDKCGSPEIIIKKKQSGQKLCSKCFLESTKKKVLKDIRRQNLIEKGDKVLLGLSGGKDSVMLLDILSTLKNRGIIDLVAVTIDEGIEGYREEGVELAIKNAEKYGVEHRVVSFKQYFGTTLDRIIQKNSLDVRRNACTYCGVFRRWIFNRVSKEVGATKIATGHNLDDETQSIIMSYLEGNIQNLTRIGPKSQSKSDKFTVKIKPLREIPEKEIGLYVIAKKLDVHFAGCPYAGESFRAEIGTFLKQLTANHPTIMYSTLRGFDRIKPVLKKEFATESVFEVCEICGEPSASRLCKACSFLKQWEDQG